MNFNFDIDKKKILAIIGAIIFIFIILLFVGLKEGGRRSASLEIWGLFDEDDVYSDFIKQYTQNNKNVTIKYTKKSIIDYEKELIDALAADKGPDIFLIHNTWLPRYENKIYPMPKTKEFFTPISFRETFVDVVYQDLVKNDKIYGIPLYVDTLALYYNRDFFNSEGIPKPPETWEEFLEDVKILTKRNIWGGIERSGAAMGTAENINRAVDIVYLLMLQTGTEMTDPEHTRATFNQSIYTQDKALNPGKDALRFYTDFANPVKDVYCWNRQMHYSIDAFAEGKTAMMINYSYHIDTIKEKSPYLNFAIAPVPQIKGREFDVNYANYWAFTVSRKSKNPYEAWRFLMFLSQRENLKKYLEKTKNPTSRRDLIEWQKNDPELKPFVDQVLSAKSWYQVDNQAIEEIFIDMIKSVVLGEATLDQAINKAADQVTVLMQKQ